jgi:hypothetical protein
MKEANERLYRRLKFFNRPLQLPFLNLSSSFTLLLTMSENGTPLHEASFYHSSVELADLGRERFDQDTAEATDRDTALHSHQHIIARTGRAPRGLETAVFAWNTFQYTTNEISGREELKGDLHAGQLHRENRIAREGSQAMGPMGGGHMGGGARGGRAVKDDGRLDALCAGRKLENDAPPLAKGKTEEMDNNMFWDGPIV